MEVLQQAVFLASLSFSPTFVKFLYEISHKESNSRSQKAISHYVQNNDDNPFDAIDLKWLRLMETRSLRFF